MKYANSIGARLALTKAFIYDTIIQHGDGDDPDGLPSIILKTNKVMRGSMKVGVDEKKWLQTFIKMRRATLAHSYDKSTRSEWAKSVDRCDAFSSFLSSGNFDLNGPVKVKTSQHSANVP